jgi:hypothetical protein
VAAQSHCKKVLKELLLYGAEPHVLTEYDQSPFALSRGTVPRDKEMEVPRFLRAWLVDCFARAIIIGFAKSEMSAEVFDIAWKSKYVDEAKKRAAEQVDDEIGETSVLWD